MLAGAFEDDVEDEDEEDVDDVDDEDDEDDDPESEELEPLVEPEESPDFAEELDFEESRESVR